MISAATVAHELYYGAYKSHHARRNVELLDRMEFETANSREFSRVEGLDSEDWSNSDADQRAT